MICGECKRAGKAQTKAAVSGPLNPKQVAKITKLHDKCSRIQCPCHHRVRGSE